MEAGGDAAAAAPGRRTEDLGDTQLPSEEETGDGDEGVPAGDGDLDGAGRAPLLAVSGVGRRRHQGQGCRECVHVGGVVSVASVQLRSRGGREEEKQVHRV